MITATGIYSAKAIDPNLQFWLRSNNTDGSTSFIDSSASQHTITAFGQTRHSTTQKLPGKSSSIYFDGSGDYLSIADHDDFEFGSGNFTISFWIYPIAVAGDYIAKRSNTDLAPFLVYGNVFYASSNNSGWDVANAPSFGTISTNTWTQITVMRSGNTISLYRGNTLANTVTTSATLHNNTYPLKIGGGTVSTNGYMDEIKIYKGVAYPPT